MKFDKKFQRSSRQTKVKFGNQERILLKCVCMCVRQKILEKEGGSSFYLSFAQI